MGNFIQSQDDTTWLLDEEDIEPIFDELNLVLIGCHGAGKNTVANAIFGKKVFTFWTSYRRVHIKQTCTVSGTKIHLARIPGWKGDLSRSQQTKMEIVHCVQTLYSTGPHAVLLVLKVNSVLSESTISTLESLLTARLWEHTIVLFTNGEKLGDYTIEDYIRCYQLQPLIDKCGQRYFVIQTNNDNQIIGTIEELIVRKKSARFFQLSSQREANDNTVLSYLEDLVERIRSKITSILAFKEKFKNQQYKRSIKKLLKSKDAEIERLNAILQEKDQEIMRLRSGTQDQNLYRRIEELEHQLDTMTNKYKEKKTENETLKKMVKEKDAVIEKQDKELEMWRDKAIEWKTLEDQFTSTDADYRRELCQNVSASSRKSLNQIQLKVFPSKGSALHSWSDTLFQVLEMLSEYELKKVKHYMWWNEEYKISRSLIEGKDRVDLADQMLKQWDVSRCVQITRDVLKKIPHNNDVTIEMLLPYLKAIGETW